MWLKSLTTTNHKFKNMWCMEELGLVNSYNTWHGKMLQFNTVPSDKHNLLSGTKNVA